MKQKNLGYEMKVIERLERFCELRGQNEGKIATIAIHAYMESSAEARESAALDCQKWLNDPEAQRASEAADAGGLAARSGALAGPRKRREPNENKAG